MNQAHKFKIFLRHFTPLDIVLAIKHFLWTPKVKKGNLLFPDGSVFVIEQEVEEGQ